MSGTRLPQMVSFVFTFVLLFSFLLVACGLWPSLPSSRSTITRLARPDHTTLRRSYSLVLHHSHASRSPHSPRSGVSPTYQHWILDPLFVAPYFPSSEVTEFSHAFSGLTQHLASTSFESSSPTSTGSVAVSHTWHVNIRQTSSPVQHYSRSTQAVTSSLLFQAKTRHTETCHYRPVPLWTHSKYVLSTLPNPRQAKVSFLNPAQDSLAQYSIDPI